MNAYIIEATWKDFRDNFEEKEKITDCGAELHFEGDSEAEAIDKAIEYLLDSSNNAKLLDGEVVYYDEAGEVIGKYFDFSAEQTVSYRSVECDFMEDLYEPVCDLWELASEAEKKKTWEEGKKYQWDCPKLKGSCWQDDVDRIINNILETLCYNVSDVDWDYNDEHDKILTIEGNEIGSWQELLSIIN